MTGEKIIFHDGGGGVAVVHPASGIVVTVDWAKTQVPTGKPFKIIDASQIPQDRSERNLWRVDPTTLTDGIGERQ